MLFDKLSEQCLVLLEDVDSAGLVSRNSNVDSAWAEDNSNSMRVPPSGISLSGLLNVTDGIASQEGRVLMMLRSREGETEGVYKGTPCSVQNLPSLVSVRIHHDPLCLLPAPHLNPPSP